MALMKKPAAGGPRARERAENYLHNSFFTPVCQPISPASWLIRENFIENLVSKPYTRKKSLMVDFWLIFADFIEGVGHVWN